MLPFLTFASGIVAGIVGVKLLKTAKTPESLHHLGDKARGGLDKAGATLRGATVSGLSAIEKSSADLRARLTPAEAEVVAEPAPQPKKRSAAKKAEAAAPAKPRRRAAKKAEPEAAESAPAPEAEAQS